LRSGSDLYGSYQPGGDAKASARANFNECLAYRHDAFLRERSDKGGDMLQVRDVRLSPRPLRPPGFLSLSSVPFCLVPT